MNNLTKFPSCEYLSCAKKKLIKIGPDICYALTGQELDCKQSSPRATPGCNSEKFFCKLLNPNRLGSRNPSEIEILSRLRHPYIVEILAFLESEPYFGHRGLGLVMPWYSLSLREYLNKKGPQLTIQEKTALCRRLCLTVCDLHELQILHLDLKASNIMLNDNFEPVLIDFGSARLTGPGLECLVHPEENFVTTEIAPPELLLPFTEEATLCGWYTDVWELGLLFLTILCNNARFYPSHITLSSGQEVGRYLQGAIFDKAALYQHVNTLLRKAQVVNPYLLKFCSLLNTLLCKDPYLRPNLKQVVKNIALQGEAKPVSYDWQVAKKAFQPLPKNNNLILLDQAVQSIIAFYKQEWGFAPIRALFASCDIFYRARHLCDEIGDHDAFLSYLTAAVCWLGLRAYYGATSKNLQALLRYFSLQSRKAVIELANRILFEIGECLYSDYSYQSCSDEEDVVRYLNDILPHPEVYMQTSNKLGNGHGLEHYLVADFYS